MRTGIACIVVALALVSGHASSASPQAPDINSAEASKARLAWFREAKFGMFIHWGVYAVPAGEWKGQRVPGIGEWIMFRRASRCAEYEQLAKQFNPVKFDADAWVQLAKDAGMKYIVITSKHHDGFAMFDSKVSHCDIVDATPSKRDILKELAAACAKHGIRWASTTRRPRTGTSRTGGGQHLGLRARRQEGLRPVPAREGRAPGARAAHRATGPSPSSGSTRRG